MALPLIFAWVLMPFGARSYLLPTKRLPTPHPAKSLAILSLEWVQIHRRGA